MRSPWQGVFPAATTQFRDDQSVDLGATLDHLERLVEAGVHGLILLGTVGENNSLDPSEKREVLKAARDRLGGRVPLLTGVAEASTKLAAEFASDAQTLGLDGLMVLPAMIYKADSREALAHFRTVAAATDLPVMIYNNPVVYSVDVTPEMFLDLADESKFVAIKESSENVRRITDLKNHCGDRYDLFCGVDDLILESVLLGAVGWVAGLVNALPSESLTLWNLAREGRWDEARELYRWFTPLLHLDTDVKLVQLIKLVAAEVGMGSEMVRAPRLPLEESVRAQVLQLVRDSLGRRPTVSQTR